METSLHQLVVRVEKVLNQKEIALGNFLDKEGAFNNISYDSICSSNMVLIRPLYGDSGIQGMPTVGRVVATSLIPGCGCFDSKAQWRWDIYSRPDK